MLIIILGVIIAFYFFIYFNKRRRQRLEDLREHKQVRFEKLLNALRAGPGSSVDKKD
jgi:hypothetical protein